MSCTNHWQGDREFDEFELAEQAEEERRNRLYEEGIAREWDGPRVDIRVGDVWLKHSTKRHIYITSAYGRPAMLVMGVCCDTKSTSRTARKPTTPHDRRNFGVKGSKGYTLVMRDGQPIDKPDKT